MEKKNIREVSPEEMAAFLSVNGEKVFRAKQIEEWIWQKGVQDFEEMTNLPKSSRELLKATYYFDKLYRIVFKPPVTVRPKQPGF